MGGSAKTKFRELLDPDIGKPVKDHCQIIAHGEVQPPTAFDNLENRRDLRSGPSVFGAAVLACRAGVPQDLFSISGQ